MLGLAAAPDVMAVRRRHGRAALLVVVRQFAYVHVLP